MRKRPSFLYGRNGPDPLSMASSILACLFLVISMFLKGVASSILWMLALLCLVYTYFRIFSRNSAKRQAENDWFLQQIRPLLTWREKHQQRRKQKSLYKFFKCPACGTVLRVPKGKGRIRITCKSCGHIFQRNS